MGRIGLVPVASFVLVAARTGGNSIAEVVEPAVIYREQMVSMPPSRERALTIGALPLKEFLHSLAVGLTDVFL